MTTSEYSTEYYALIEREDGSTYLQPYCDFYELVELAGYLGDDYRICAIYSEVF